MIIWKGPSQIDGQPIVLLAVGLEADSSNSKTGAMVQCYILADGINPIAAVRAGADRSICGDCRHRGKLLNGTIVGRSCYVTLMHGPRVVYDAYARGVYPEISLFDAQRAFAGRRVRMGAYGDPAAIPFIVWLTILLRAQMVTGYTHQWRTCPPAFSQFVMASVDSVDEQAEAEALGYRTFRVRGKGEIRLKSEAPCGASKEMGHKTTCSDCGACGGHDSKARCNIVIEAHGAGAGHFRQAA